LVGCATDKHTSVQEVSPPASEKKYSADDIRLHDMDYFFQKLGERDSEYHYYAAMWALGSKCKTDPQARDKILDHAHSLFDTSKSTNVRIQCIGVVADAGARDYADFIIEALHNDRSEQIRGFAANSLLFFKDKTLIPELKEALKTERSESVIHSIQATIDRLSKYPD
jgi:HEAT repeat protein